MGTLRENLFKLRMLITLNRRSNCHPGASITTFTVPKSELSETRSTVSQVKVNISCDTKRFLCRRELLSELIMNIYR